MGTLFGPDARGSVRKPASPRGRHDPDKKFLLLDYAAYKKTAFFLVSAKPL
jgi:hypothetical protein